MKIIFITREGYNLSGARVRCFNFARQLKELGMETEVFSFAERLGAKYGEEEFQMPFARKLSLNFPAIKYLSAQKGAVFFIQRLNYHTLAPWLVSLFRKNRIVFDCDDWNIREDPKCYFNCWPSSKMEFFTRLICGYADACISASHYLYEYFGKFSKSMHYIPTGVDTDIFKPKNNVRGDSKLWLSWIGTIYHPEMRNNIMFLLECFSVLAAKYPQLFLRLAGTGAYFKDIEAAVNELPCRRQVLLDGWVSPDDIPAYLEGIDIGTLPLMQETRFNMAKSPTKLFEYMAMAKPTVSSRVGEAARIIREADTGFLAKDKNEFIDKVAALVEDEGLRKRTGEKARACVESQYCLRVLGRQLQEILQKEIVAG